MQRQVKWTGRGRQLALLALLASCLATGYYLWSSLSRYGGGFPLDDAWIHQTYARNLAQRGEWAFLPGEWSSGSTSPIWTLLITLGYLASLPIPGFTYALGILVLVLITWLIGWGSPALRTIQSKVQVLLILLVPFEWHLVWAALSGMETLLLGLHILLILIGLERRWDPLLLGAMAGLGIWIRPDGLLSLLPIAWVLLTRRSPVREILSQSLKIVIGFLLLAIPYLLINVQIGGEWWPSTYFAKQVEYAIYREDALPARLIKVGMAPLVGVGFMLLPGVFIQAYQSLHERSYARLAGALWLTAFISAYALRLPVDYQHGRYMIPVIPALFLLAYEGFSQLAGTSGRSSLYRILSRAWLLSSAIITMAFWINNGAKAYVEDVGFIETEMVVAAKWVETNTNAGDLIAAHDIGALGYFGDRSILDLAGLISPEVIPFIRDERALEIFLNEAGADFLMTFPGWYPALTRNRTVIYTTEGSVSPSLGGENMTIYRWP